MSRKWFFLLLVALIIAAGWMVIGQNTRVESEKEINDDLVFPRVSLSYQAERQFDPEVAEIVLGVETIAKDLNKAFAENNDKMEKINEELQKKENLTINTSTFHVFPLRGEGDNEDTVSYNVVNKIIIRTGELKDIGEIIQTAVSAGANQVQSINYSLENKEEAVRQVTEEALQGIQGKLQYLASSLGRDPGELLTLNVDDRLSGRNFFNLLKSEAEGGPELPVPPITPQKINIVVNVNATYELK